MSAADLSGEPDLRSIGHAIWAKKVMIFAVTLVATAGAFLVVNSVTPRYQSETKLLLEGRENVFMRADADKGVTERTGLDEQAVTSQIQLVLSRDVAREVIKKENLAQSREFDPAVGGHSLSQALLGLIGLGRDYSAMSSDERTLAAYYDRINAYAVEKSRVIAIDFSSADPELAARVANAIAEAYLASQRSAKSDQTKAASSWLATEIERCGPALPTPKPRSRNIAPSPICSSAPTIPRCRISSSPRSIRRSRPRVGRRPTSKRAPSSCANWCGRGSRSTRPISPIRNRCAA